MHISSNKLLFFDSRFGQNFFRPKNSFLFKNVFFRQKIFHEINQEILTFNHYFIVANQIMGRIRNRNTFSTIEEARRANDQTRRFFPEGEEFRPRTT